MGRLRKAAYCLLLPGRTLHLNALLIMKKFRDRGNKGAVHAFLALLAAELGNVVEIKPQRGTIQCTLVFHFKLAF